MEADQKNPVRRAWCCAPFIVGRDLEKKVGQTYLACIAWRSLAAVLDRPCLAGAARSSCSSIERTLGQPRHERPAQRVGPLARASAACWRACSAAGPPWKVGPGAATSERGSGWAAGQPAGPCTPASPFFLSLLPFPFCSLFIWATKLVH
jgi:hypothetical protein